MLVGVFILVAVGGLFWLAYRRPRPRRWLIPRRPALATRATGRTAEYDATPRIEATPFETELARPLGRDATEQASRWADAAAALRKLNRTDTLPAVLRCANETTTLPEGAVLAAEAVGFPNFATTLCALAGPECRVAVRALARAARGARDGVVDLAALVRAGLGDHLAVISESAPKGSDPWLTAAMVEAERVARRAEHWVRHLPADARALAEQQGSRLAASAARRQNWLATAAQRLLARFPAAPADEQTAILRVLDDLRADVSALFPTLPDRRMGWWAEAVPCLRWARARVYGPLLTSQAERLVAARRPASAAVVALSALRGCHSADAERVLLVGASHTDPAVRRAALGAFGWTDPFDRATVIGTLQAARTDSDRSVRRAAVAARARFGELAALRELAEGLIAEVPAVRHATILLAADEEVSWMWPDLDLVAEKGDPDTALAAAEALERLREAALGLLG